MRDESKPLRATSNHRRMKHIATVFANVGLAAFFVVAHAGEDEPRRRSGLWQMQLTLDDGSYTIPASEMCIDAKTEARLTLVGAQMDRARCSSYRLAKRADGSWSFYSVCRLDEDAATATTTGSAKGDFQTTYSVDATGVTSGTSTPGMNGSHRITIEAKWLGPCPTDMTAGDVRSGGKITNVFSKAAN